VAADPLGGENLVDLPVDVEAAHLGEIRRALAR
jgi:hypothetical protein